MTNEVEDFIKHHGVKGMRWGVRRKRGSNGRIKSTSPAKPKAKDLSDDDLRKTINRMQMEKQYSTLTSSKSKKRAGADFVKSVAGTVAKTAVTAVVTQQVNKAMKKAKITT